MSCSPTYSYRPTFTPGETCVAPFFAEHRSRLFEGEMFFRSKDQGPETSWLELEIDLSNLYVYFYGVLVETFPVTFDEGSIASLRAQVTHFHQPIVAVTPGVGGIFFVTGDYTTRFFPGAPFSVIDSTGNDGPYTVTSSIFMFGNTEITVTGTIPNAVADGEISTGSHYIEMPPLNFDVYDNRAQEDDTLLDFTPGGVTTFARTHMRGGTGAPTDAVSLSGIRTGPERSIIILATTEDIEGNDVTPPWNRRVQQWTGSMWATYSNLVPNACPFP